MAKILLTIDADNKAAESVALLKKQIDALSKSLSSIRVNKDLTAQIKALTQNYTAVINAQMKLAQNANKQAAGVETTRKGYANLVSTLKTLKTQYANNVFGNLPNDVERAFKKIQELSEAFQKNGKLTAQQQKAYAQLAQQLKKFSADVATAKAKHDKLVSVNPFTVTQAQQIPRLTKQYSTLLNTIKNTEKYYPKGTFDTFKQQLTDGQTKLQALNEEFQATGTLSENSQKDLNDLANGFNQINANVAKTTSTLKSSKGSLKDIVAGFLKFQVSAMLVMKPLQMIRSALTSINETLVKTEDTVIALQRVLPSGSASDSEISGKLYGLAQQYGQTFENVSQIATNFARAGMDWADTIKATEAAVLALNVAELDATEASDGMIAILTQFGLKASELQLVVDKLNITADNAAVTTEKLLAALQRTGSAAKNARLSLDETLGVITALSEATGRSGENLGTAINSLIQYSSKASALDTFAGLSEQSAAVVAQFRQGGANILDVWRQVSEEIQNLKADQADLLDQYFATEDGEALKDALDGELEDIYTELGGVYDTANTFRKNYFIALLGNMDTVEEAIGTLGDAAGYSQKENEKYLATYTAKLNSLKAQWQSVANSAQGVLGIKKVLVDIGSVLLTIIKWTGGLRTTLLAILTVVWTLVGSKIIAGIKAIGTAIKGLITGLTTAKTAAQGLQAALGVIGLAATVISMIVGIVQQAKENAETLDAEALTRASDGLSTLRDNVQDNIDRFDQLAQSVTEARAVLADSTSTTAEVAAAQKTLTSIQDALRRSNSAYADSLDLTNGKLSEQLGLLNTMGEESARKKVKEYLDQNADAIYNAKQYDNAKSSDIVFGEAEGLWTSVSDAWHGNGSSSPLKKWLDSLGYSTTTKSSGFWDGVKSFFTNSGSLNTVLEAGAMTKDEQLAFLEELFTQAGYEENHEYLQAQIREAINAIENDQTYKDVKALLSGTDNTWGAPIEVLEKFVNSDDPNAYKTFLKEIGLLEEEAAIEAGEWHNNIEKVTKKYDDLIDKLEELRDKDKEILDLEKAKLELENAQNEATVRRYNEATGQWEWQTDEKRIAEARENLEEQAYDTIIDQLQNNTATNDGLNALLDGLVSYLGADFISKIKEAIYGTTYVDLDKPVNSYDSGGIASGMGYMPKATDRPETVNNPDLTAKILSPVSNEQFNRYVHDMGLLFETSRQYAQSAPTVERVGGNTDNSVNNSGQIIMNGVSIGSDRRASSLDEILALGGIVPNA